MTKWHDIRAARLIVSACAMLIGVAACAPMTTRQSSRPTEPVASFPRGSQETASASPASMPVSKHSSRSIGAVPPTLQRYRDDWFDAARSGRWDILQAMIAAGFPIDIQNDSGYTAAILAAYDNRPDTLQHLIHAGADICVRDTHGNNALMGALFKGNQNVVGILLRGPCDIDAENYAGETALVFAVVFGRMQWFDPLLARGANPAHRDRRGQSVMDIAEAQQNRAVIIALNKALAGRPMIGTHNATQRSTPPAL